MNPTIEKIVNLLFEDLVETDETRSIRDEILQNCQERYQDLRDAGISEDDAIHAVVESLSGMEEMLSEYPRKADEPAAASSEEPEDSNTGMNEGPCTWSCDPAQSPIREIRMEHMANADVYVQSSPDHLVHVEVECAKSNVTLMTGLDKGVLNIALSEQKENEIKDEIKFSLQDGIDLTSIGRLFEKIAKRFTANMTGTEITLSIPDSLCPALHIGTARGDITVGTMPLDRLVIGSASGDVEIESITVQNELRVTSASGDITVTDAHAQQMQLSSTSGDIEASNCTAVGSVRLNTTSGDISWCKYCKALNANSISGDLTLEGYAESISFHTVSGDAEISPADGQPVAISGNTTSGDVSVSLPEGLQADVSCSSVSGSIHHHASSVPGAPVTIKVSTVSGDIEIN